MPPKCISLSPYVGLIYSRCLPNTFAPPSPLQYIVVDHKLFEPGMKPKNGFLTVVEQMPGLMMVVDRTDELAANGFVPSINTPSIEYVFDYAGYPQKIANTTSDPGYWSALRARVRGVDGVRM